MRNSILLLLLLIGGVVVGQTQKEMNDSAFVAYEKADAELNKVYQELVAQLDAEETKLLITAQRYWIGYRDAHCEFEKKPSEGGSIQPLVYATCLTEVTEQRIKELKASLLSRKER
ncbi:lysozyme inhibitor LprI family protein [Flavobacterium capsici]|uniref:Lysozyme inhibitor LprI family protein n=1 Tax=Flavobacterium capsici TaxID=3075618 RepID=A0AA96EW54_9FLAO|nr:MULTISPECIES: lysozyme inhibitor LprI family protein [unclassified Flavobacterium]WNM18047.1 lysozyme inhibitor LprI family protein [Flavobacterium sp. PMR2A8]WNM22099.1 lysozyme inhibitor LprI family protein [Flavobacterium sp. PMTSA4]